MTKPAVVLFSGGLDSTTVLAQAMAEGYQCYPLSFSYHQKHHSELQAAKRTAAKLGLPHKIVNLELGTLTGSALTDDDKAVEDFKGLQAMPATYVPARNTVFLSIALSYAEVLNAYDIFIGVSAIDYSGYPDCRPAFVEAFEHLANVATQIGSKEQRICIHAPLLHLSKADTIHLGLKLGVNYAETVSCYRADAQTGAACGTCDSCALRKQGFTEAGVTDPTLYKNTLAA